MGLKYRLKVNGIKQRELAEYCDRGLRIINKYLNMDDEFIPRYIIISAEDLIKKKKNKRKKWKNI